MKFLLASLLAATVMAISSVRADGYIAFYSDSSCKNQVGSVHYSMSNNGCFANGGSYMKVVDGWDGADGPYKLVVNQNKNAGCNGGNQATASFPTDPSGGCHNMGGAGFITGGNGADHPYNIHVENS